VEDGNVFRKVGAVCASALQKRLADSACGGLFAAFAQDEARFVAAFGGEYPMDWCSACAASTASR
jgi:hypothetical protein